MCVVSNMSDYGNAMWHKPWYQPNPIPAQPVIFPPPAPYTGPTKEQFEEFLELMRAAKKFDEKTGQKDCEAESKIGWMRELAAVVGVDPAKVDEILKK